jgi:hypothetical protein
LRAVRRRRGLGMRRNDFGNVSSRLGVWVKLSTESTRRHSEGTKTERVHGRPRDWWLLRERRECVRSLRRERDHDGDKTVHDTKSSSDDDVAN